MRTFPHHTRAQTPMADDDGEPTLAVMPDDRRTSAWSTVRERLELSSASATLGMTAFLLFGVLVVQLVMIAISAELN